MKIEEVDANSRHTMADKLSDEQIAEWDDEWEAELRLRRALRDYDGWEWFGRKTAYIAHKAYRAGQAAMREEAANRCYRAADHYRDNGLTFFEDAARECGSLVSALPISEE